MFQVGRINIVKMIDVFKEGEENGQLRVQGQERAPIFSDTF